MDNKEQFYALVKKMENDPFPSREDIVKALSFLTNEEMNYVYSVIKEKIKRGDL